MPHKLRKTRKMRGSRTHGYGRIGQHRDAGSKGQRKVGRHKHLWSYVVTHEPDYFGKKGFTSPQSLKRKENTINIKQLNELTLEPDKPRLHQTPRHRQNRKTPNHNSGLMLQIRNRKNKKSRRKNLNTVQGKRRVALINGWKIPKPLQTSRKSTA
jgi:hypothetical protein